MCSHIDSMSFKNNLHILHMKKVLLCIFQLRCNHKKFQYTVLKVLKSTQPKIIFCNTWTDTWVHKCDQKQIHRVAFRTKLQFFYRCILRRYHQFWDTWDYIFCTIYYLLLVSIWRIPCTGGCLQDPEKASEFAKTNGGMVSVF